MENVPCRMPPFIQSAVPLLTPGKPLVHLQPQSVSPPLGNLSLHTVSFEPHEVLRCMARIAREAEATAPQDPLLPRGAHGLFAPSESDDNGELPTPLPLVMLIDSSCSDGAVKSEQWRTLASSSSDLSFCKSPTSSNPPFHPISNRVLQNRCRTILLFPPAVGTSIFIDLLHLHARFHTCYPSVRR